MDDMIAEPSSAAGGTTDSMLLFSLSFLPNVISNPKSCKVILQKFNNVLYL
jgi:hypothetical protein